MDDIIRMAKEAGFAVNEKARQHQPNCIFHTQYMVDELLKRFAELVRADEREACAYKAGIALLGADRGLANRVDQAIRARSNT